ncbi:hypothetical protein LguiB_033328 [Lonicera macranthoides]
MMHVFIIFPRSFAFHIRAGPLTICHLFCNTPKACSTSFLTLSCCLAKSLSLEFNGSEIVCIKVAYGG